jgi:hypothetical protein
MFPFLATKAAELLAPVVAKFSSPLVKWGSIAGAVVLVLLVTNWKTYDYMRTRCEQSKLTALAEQAQQAGLAVIAQEDETKRVLQAHAEAERDLETRVNIVEREVVRYVQSPHQPCELDPAAVRLFDSIARLPNDPDLVPPADGGAGEPADASEAGLTTFEALQAYYDAVETLAFLWIDYAALVEWERGRYIVERTRYEGGSR